jgi:hypothetical protein
MPLGIHDLVCGRKVRRARDRDYLAVIDRHTTLDDPRLRHDFSILYDQIDGQLDTRDMHLPFYISH